jgi:hypothetical protein
VSAPTLKVVEIGIDNLRDPAKQLRNIADGIDAGEYGEVTSLAVAMLGNQLHIFGGGADYFAPSVALLMRAASLRMEREIEEFGR